MDCGSSGLGDVEVVLETVGVDDSHGSGISRRVLKQLIGILDNVVLRDCDVGDPLDVHVEGLCDFGGNGVLDVGVGHFGNLSSLS